MQLTPARAGLGTMSPNPFAPRSLRPHGTLRSGSSLTTNRIVRFTEEFFDQLDVLLPEERGADGRPSVTDFMVFEAPTIGDKLGRDYEGETLSTDDAVVRVYVGNGVLVRQVAVFARLEHDDSVAAFWLSLDMPDPDSE